MKKILKVFGFSLLLIGGIASAQSFSELSIKIPSEGGSTNFGGAADVSGVRAVVGADSDDGGDGAVYVYSWDGSAWNQTHKLIASDGAGGDRFGYSVAVDGDRIIVGAPYDDDNGSGSGSVYIYDWSGSSWDETKITASDGAAGDDFGKSVDINGDRIVAGAPSDDDHQPNSGSVYIYDWNGSSWDEGKVNLITGVTGDKFGDNVSVSGNRFMVGAFGTSSGLGAAYVYNWNGSSWVETDLTPAGLGFDFYGNSVSIDGDRALVGATYGGVADTGSVYIYDWNGSSWDEEQIVASDGADSDQFGSAVGVSGDKILVGAKAAPAAYFFLHQLLFLRPFERLLRMNQSPFH